MILHSSKPFYCEMWAGLGISLLLHFYSTFCCPESEGGACLRAFPPSISAESGQQHGRGEKEFRIQMRASKFGDTETEAIQQQCKTLRLRQRDSESHRRRNRPV